VGNYIPITQVCNEAAKAYMKQVEAQTGEMLMPFRELCESYQVIFPEWISVGQPLVDALLSRKAYTY